MEYVQLSVNDNEYLLMRNKHYKNDDKITKIKQFINNL